MTDDQERLRRENVRLKALLAKHGIEIPKEATGDPHFGSPKTRALSSEQKIELFRSLFMGRQDVYAVRWESPDGRKDTVHATSATGRPTTRHPQKIVHG